MDKLISFWAAPDWWLLGFIAGAFVVVIFGVYWWRKVAAKNKEKEQKKRAITLGVEHINQLFKIRKVENDKSLGLLSPDPTLEYSSGTGYPVWAKLANVPGDLKAEGKVIKVTQGADGNLIIKKVLPHELPTEKETLALKEAKALALKEAAALELEQAKALELQQAKKTT